MEDTWAWFLLFFKKSWAGGFPFSKYPICFSIQTFQNSASSITFTVTSSSPKSLLMVQQHTNREQLSLWALSVLKLPKSAAKNAARAKLMEAVRSPPHTHQFLPHPPHLPPAQISWATPKLTTPLKICLLSVGSGKLIHPEVAQSLDVRQGKEQGHTWE